MMGLTLPVVAQDSLRVSIGYQEAQQTLKQQAENRPYTLRWGEMKVLAGASLAGDWNDNVNLSHSAPLSDFIIRPLANLDVFWPVTDLNALTISLGVGYYKYIEHDQYDRLLITPGSQLGWDIFIKDFRINLHDHVSYDEDPLNTGAVSGVGTFGGLNNTAGLNVAWDLHDVVLSTGYDHVNQWYTSSTYEYLNHASDFVFFRASFQVHPSLQLGLETSGGPTDYEQHVMRDNMTYSFGAFADWKISDHITAHGRGGYYHYSFSDIGSIGTGSDQDGYYFSVNLAHELQRNINYSLEVGRETFFGVYSSLTDQWYGTAQINWRIIENLSVSTGFRYEQATQPLVSGLSDSYDRMSVSLGLSCPIKEKITASLQYNYWLKQADVQQSLDYEQNVVSLMLAYRF
jgi:hypothetical protein